MTQLPSSEKQKICQVASADISLRFLLFEQMKFLQEKGFEVWAVSSPGHWIPKIEESGVHVETVVITRRILTPLSDVRALVRLYRLFRRERFELVHTHTLKASFLGQIAAFLARVPVRVYTIHGLDFENPAFPSWKKYMFASIEKIISILVQRAFSVNKEDTDKSIRKGVYAKEKIRYLPLGIDLEVFNPYHFPQNFIEKKKAELGIPQGFKILGIVARLVKEKGYLELFAALKIVLEKFPNTVLLVVGPEEPAKDDHIHPSVVKRYGVEENVIFLGEQTDVEELYAIMDIFVLPTYREGLGISILEASAMETPVVATAIRGCREAAENGKTAILVPPRNAEKVAEAILELLEHPEKAEAMGKAGRQKVEREFNEKTIEAELLQEYRQLLEKRKAK